MLLSVKTTITAATTALALTAASIAPVHAWGSDEQNFLKGVASTLVVQGLIRDVTRDRSPRYYAPAPQPVYVAPPTYAPPVYAPAPVYYTPAPTAYNVTARAFANYTSPERRAIQRRLAAQGYYYGAIDGAYGPGTWRALAGYAADTGATSRLTTMAGAFAVMDGLLY